MKQNIATGAIEIIKFGGIKMLHKKKSKLYWIMLDIKLKRDIFLTKLKQLHIVKMGRFIISCIVMLAVGIVISVGVNSVIVGSQQPTEPIKVQYEPYIVKAEDTLSELVIHLPGDYRMWVKEVQEYNDIDANIKVGQRIWLPREVRE